MNKYVKTKGVGRPANVIPDHVMVLQQVGEEDPETEGIPLYQCTICSKKFRTKAHTKYHNSCASGVKPLLCEKCGKGYMTKSHLKYHLGTHTGTETFFRCSFCPRTYNRKGNLDNHMKLIHSDASDVKSDPKTKVAVFTQTDPSWEQLLNMLS